MNTDQRIITAINLLMDQGEKVTPANVQRITGLKLHKIYSSQHIDKIDVRKRRQNSCTVNLGELLPQQSKTTDLDLRFQFMGTSLTINLFQASASEIDETIVDLNFMLTKATQRLEREKVKLQSEEKRDSFDGIFAPENADIFSAEALRQGLAHIKP